MTLFLCQVTLLPQFSPPTSGALPQGPTPRFTTSRPAATLALGVHRARLQVARPHGAPLAPLLSPEGKAAVEGLRGTGVQA